MICRYIETKKLVILSLTMILIFFMSSCESAGFAKSLIRDCDSDSIENTLEAKNGSDPNAVDTDKDGLSDYEEYYKYHTDPLKMDSDNDGKPDGDWEERREYAYTIRAICEIRYPANIKFMNDLYQDVRLLDNKTEDTNLSTIELIIYPFSTPHIYSQPYPVIYDNVDMQRYLAPSVAMNFSPGMEEDVQNIVAGSTTDVEAIKRIIHWISSETMLVKYNPHWDYFDIVNKKIMWNKSFGSKKEDEKFLNTNFYGDSMFKNRVHGTCSSLAILRTSMYRAAGLPARIIQTLPLITYYTGDIPPLVEKLSNRAMAKGYSWGPGNGGANHMYNEIFLNNRWVRVDYAIGTGPFVDNKLFVKVYYTDSFNNLKEGWNGNRCFRALEITDSYPKHKSKYIETDLSITPEQLSIIKKSDGYFIASVDINYQGIEQSPSFEVCFYSGDPNNGGEKLYQGKQLVKEAIPNRTLTVKSLPFKLKRGEHKIYVVVDSSNEITESSETNNKAFKTIVVESNESQKTQNISLSRNSTSLPNIFVMSPPGLGMFKTICNICKNTTFNKTQLSHALASYDKVFIDGVYNKKPGDIVLLLFRLDALDRIPPQYKDLLPKPWEEIENTLKTGKSEELSNKARDLNIIILASPTKSELKSLILKSKLLNAYCQENAEQKQSQHETTWYSNEPVGPVIYTVSLTENDPYIAKVNCKINIKTDTPIVMSMNNNGAPQVTGGYAYFIKNLKIIDSNNNEVPFETISSDPWKIQFNTNVPMVKLDYEVLLKYGNFSLPYGPDETPYVTENNVFWTGRALFVCSNMKDITINFNLPNKWHVSTPWQPAASSDLNFLTLNKETLTNAFIFIGPHIQKQIQIGNTKILLAVDNNIQSSTDVLSKNIKELMNAYSKLFRGTLNTSTLIIVSPYDKKGSFDGGVFGSSISMLFGDAPNEKNTYQWIHFLAHELFHLWNGQSIVHNGQESWFSEGFTDYYALITCARLGLINEKEFIYKLERACEQYYSKSGYPIRNSREYALQYAGGSLVALCLDIQIRKCTNNTRCLDDVMNKLYSDFGGRKKQYSLADVIRITNDIAGVPLNKFFDRYVQGTEELPLEACFELMRLDFKKEIIQELPKLDYVVHEMLRIQSLGYTSQGLIIRRSQDAGYQDDDLLVAINGNSVTTFNDLRKTINGLNPGDKIKLSLIRSGKPIILDITLAGKLPIPTEKEVDILIKKQSTINCNQRMFYGILQF